MKCEEVDKRLGLYQVSLKPPKRIGKTFVPPNRPSEQEWKKEFCNPLARLHYLEKNIN